MCIFAYELILAAIHGNSERNMEVSVTQIQFNRKLDCALIKHQAGFKCAVPQYRMGTLLMLYSKACMR